MKPKDTNRNCLFYIIFLATSLIMAACGERSEESHVAVPPEVESPVKALQTVNATRIAAANQEPGNWLTHGRTYDEQRFSPSLTMSSGLALWPGSTMVMSIVSGSAGFMTFRPTGEWKPHPWLLTECFMSVVHGAWFTLLMPSAASCCGSTTRKSPGRKRCMPAVM